MLEGHTRLFLAKALLTTYLDDALSTFYDSSFNTASRVPRAQPIIYQMHIPKPTTDGDPEPADEASLHRATELRIAAEREAVNSVKVCEPATMPAMREKAKDSVREDFCTLHRSIG